MSSSPEQPPRTRGGSSPAGGDGPPTTSTSITAAYVPKTDSIVKLPAQFPASFGRYQLLKLLGKGGMGAVYLAHDTQLDRHVALKIPLFRLDDDSQVLARFYREARSAATIFHANVCPVYDVGEIDGIPYLTMGYIDGKSLAAWIRNKPMPPHQSASLVSKLALALQEAHNKGVIHRDLKPANIMMDQRGEPVITDFGLARRTRPGDPQLTQQGVVMGTPAYMPPEQVSGNPEAIGPACDIYSLGVILYELLAGRLPFSGDSMAMISQVLLEEPPTPSQLRPDVDAALERICLKAMAKKVSNRYASMAEFAAALQAYLTGPASPQPSAGDPTALPTEPALPLFLTAERKPSSRITALRGRSLWGWIVGGAAVVVLLCAALVLLLRPKGPVSSAPETATAIHPENGFLPLFNGENLSGWEAASGDAGVWRVADNAMIFRLTDPLRQRGWLVTERDYTDFLLRLEFQLSPGASSGVGLRTWPGSPKVLKIQIQDDAFPAFAAHGAKQRTGALYEVAESVATGTGLRTLGEWNQMEIELRGWRLRVTVNGKNTLETRLNDDAVFRYLDGAPPSSGRIGLQHWLGSVRFRSLQIKDLSGADDTSARR
jgi:predicted Ser/Thr protein kinase